MGSISYDGTIVHFDDRVLTHLQIVIVQKFAKDESFLMSWKNAASSGDGRGSIWLSPTIPLYFSFNGSRVPSINEEWLLALGSSAKSSTGLIVTGENGELVETDQSPGDYPGTLPAGRAARNRHP